MSEPAQRSTLTSSTMSLNILQLATEFTQDSVATVESPCERPSCSTIIQPGENRFYYGPEGRPDLPGRYVCQSCNKHYLNKKSTTARVVPTTAISSASGKQDVLLISYPSMTGVRLGANFSAGTHRDSTRAVTSGPTHTPQNVVNSGVLRGSSSVPVLNSGPSGTSPIDMQVIRRMINESQRQGMFNRDQSSPLQKLN